MTSLFAGCFRVPPTSRSWQVRSNGTNDCLNSVGHEPWRAGVNCCGVNSCVRLFLTRLFQNETLFHFSVVQFCGISSDLSAHHQSGSKPLQRTQPFQYTETAARCFLLQRRHCKTNKCRTLWIRWSPVPCEAQEKFVEVCSCNLVVTGGPWRNISSAIALQEDAP